MKRLFGQISLHAIMSFGVIAVFSVILSSCAFAPPPCAQIESGIKTVSGHQSFQFRRDWSDFRSGVAAFRKATKMQDAQELRGTTTELSRSIAAIKRYSPRNAGETCEAFAVAKVKLDSSVPRLEQLAASTDWPAASKLASELTNTSEQLREALPSTWFTRHRHGKHFH